MPKIQGKKVLVTGGAGFIGSHLCDRLLAHGAAKVVCLDNFFLGKEENLSRSIVAQTSLSIMPECPMMQTG